MEEEGKAYTCLETHKQELELKMEVEKESRHICRVMRTSSICTFTQVSIRFVEAGKRKQKGGQGYITENQTRSAWNIGKNIGREDIIHTRHRLKETGKQTNLLFNMGI